MLVEEGLRLLEIAEREGRHYEHVDVGFGIIAYCANQYYQAGWEIVGMVAAPNDGKRIRLLLEKRVEK